MCAWVDATTTLYFFRNLKNILSSIPRIIVSRYQKPKLLLKDEETGIQKNKWHTQAVTQPFTASSNNKAKRIMSLIPRHCNKHTFPGHYELLLCYSEDLLK